MTTNFERNTDTFAPSSLIDSTRKHLQPLSPTEIILEGRVLLILSQTRIGVDVARVSRPITVSISSGAGARTFSRLHLFLNRSVSSYFLRGTKF